MKKVLLFLLLFIMSVSLYSCKDKEIIIDNGNSDGGSGGNEIEPSKYLVVYFSLTNNTERVATIIKDELKAHIHEIEPSVAYVDEDVVYYDETCRSWIEQHDNDSHPDIKEDNVDLNNYTFIFLGYPIWYNLAPRVIYSFLERHRNELDGKYIIPFCTSGSTSILLSTNDLYGLYLPCAWIKGKRFEAEVKEEDVITWINSLTILKENDE